jgi:membrane protein
MPFTATLRTLGQAVKAWWNDDAMRLGASLAYYTLFAIGPILLVAVAVAGTLFGAEAVRGEVVGQIEGLVGTEGAMAVQALLQGASRRQDNIFAAIVGGVTFVLAACGAFLELQAALNAIWRVTPKPGGMLKDFFLDRVRSFGLVVAIGFLLLVSLGVDAALAAFAYWLAQWAPAVPVVLGTLNFILSVAVTSALFGLLFKFLPDVELAWSDVATGAFVTALLFAVGKHVIGLYLGQSGTTSSYGAAGSVIVILLWVYYTSQIVLFGAEFTRLYAERVRGPVAASPFAAKVENVPGPRPTSAAGTSTADLLREVAAERTRNQLDRSGS